MPMKRIPLAEATREQLDYQARTVMQLMITGRPGADTLRALIKQADPDISKIEVEVPEEEMPAGPLPMMGHNSEGALGPIGSASNPDMMLQSKGFSGLRHRVLVPAQPVPGGGAPVPVGVNGFAISVLRGKEVAIPVEHFALLKKSTSGSYEEPESLEEPLGTRREAMRYTVQDLGPVS